MTKLLTILSLVSLLLFSACANDPEFTSDYTPKTRNILGIIKHEPASFAPVGPATQHTSTVELFSPDNVSGDKTTLFWGLITLTDY